MCGLAGISSNRIDENTKTSSLKILDFLSHRGPDDSGYFISKDILMLHTRLSIIDIPGGGQPIEGSQYILTANGEIYNDLEIREENRDYKYETGSDCESIICVYNNFGIEGFSKLRGMYAFSLYDKKKNELIIGRDPFGIKPLYFSFSNGKFIYSSEPQALIKSGLIVPRISKQKTKELLQLQFCIGRETIYKGIFRLRPGETLIIKKGEVIKSELFNKTNAFKRLLVNNKKINDTLSESISLHQRSDVPYGVFFSGGIDSTLVLYLMSKINTKPINSYSVIFPGEKQKEKLMKKLCKDLNSKLHCIEFDKNDFWNLIPQTAKAFDDPVIDYAILPTFKLAQEAKKDLKVVLTGEGGDELFAGYGRYRSSLRNFFFKKEPFHKGPFTNIKNFSTFFDNWNFELEKKRSYISNLNLTELQKVQILDYEEWLPNDLLIKLDRSLMFHGLEGRTPLIDLKVFHDLFGVEDFRKINKGFGKFFLRQFLKEKIPAYDSFERKSGFTVPLNIWIPEMYIKFSQTLPKIKCLTELFPSKLIKDLCLSLKTNKKAIIPIWRLTFFALWFIANIEKKSVDGSTFDVLYNNL